MTKQYVSLISPFLIEDGGDAYASMLRNGSCMAFKPSEDLLCVAHYNVDTNNESNSVFFVRIPLAANSEPIANAILKRGEDDAFDWDVAETIVRMCHPEVFDIVLSSELSEDVPAAVDALVRALEGEDAEIVSVIMDLPKNQVIAYRHSVMFEQGDFLDDGENGEEIYSEPVVIDCQSSFTEQLIG